MEIEEKFLSSDLIAKAVRSGKEYGWKRSEILNVLQEARTADIAPTGGQVQFVFSDGTCKLYWLSYEVEEIKESESWKDYCTRCSRQIQEQVHKLPSDKNIVAEGIENFDFLRKKANEGAHLEDSLYLIIYFSSKS